MEKQNELNQEVDKLRNRGYLLIERSDYKGAFEVFKRGSRLAPKDPVMLYDLARTLRELGRFDEARIAIERALQIDPAEPHFYHALGNVRRSLNDLDGAVRAYEMALELNPEFFAWNNLGLSLIQLERDEEAMSALERGLAIEPNDPDLHENLAQALFNLNFFEESLKHQLFVVRHSPQLVRGWSDLADIYLNTNQHDLAESAVKSAIAIDNSDPDLWNQLALVYEEQGRATEMRAALEQMDRLNDLPKPTDGETRPRG